MTVLFTQTFPIYSASYSNSTFDVIVTKHTQFGKDVLALFLKLLKPSGKFSIESSDGNLSELKENAILSGFVNVQENASGEFVILFFYFRETRVA